MSETAPLPGYLRFIWMFFMQPISLHRQMKAGLVHKVQLQYLARGACLLFVASPFAVALIGLICELLWFEWNWKFSAFGSAAGMVAGVFTGIASGLGDGPAERLAYGVAAGVAFQVAFAVTLGAAPGIGDGVPSLAAVVAILGAPFGVTLGVAHAVAHGVAPGAVTGITRSVPAGLVVGLSVGLVPGLSAGVSTGVGVGVAAGVIFEAAFLLAFLRLPVWLVESLEQAWMAVLATTGRRTLRYSPVFWHELSYLPLPFLGRHIEEIARLEPALAKRALEACSVIPGQRAIGQRTLLRLQGRELETLARSKLFRPFIEEATEWLPPESGAERAVNQLRQVARYLVATETSSFPHHRREHLRHAARALDGAKRQALENRSSEVDWLHPALLTWHRVIEEWTAKAETEAAHLLPNPFRAGDPLEPEVGREVFRGREASIQEIEEHLALAAETRSVVLLGPRRAGKSSLLKMLPAMLPDAVCIFFDALDKQIETPAAFFAALEKETRNQARRTRAFELPGLPPGAPFESASAWFERLEQEVGGRRLLLCIDEFEALERAFSSRDDRLRLLGLFRSIIQYRRHVRLLVAGEAHFDELDPMWDGHFVSARMVRLGHLAPETAFDLVRRPIPEFPPEAFPEPVAHRLVKRTGSQPFLVQLYAQLLVSRLNDTGRREANLEDLEPVEGKVMEESGSYFRDLWNRAPAEVQAVLGRLAHGENAGDLPRTARRWLERRCLLDPSDQLSIPVFGRFLREEIL